FQAEDGIRDLIVTGVQTCALPIFTILLTVLFGVFVLVIKNQHSPAPVSPAILIGLLVFRLVGGLLSVYFYLQGGVLLVWWWTLRSEERRVGKECRARWWADY